MSLAEYRRKRRFAVTPEPKGKVRRGRPGYSFVVQKHDASRLHYDFRLELNGVLKSWAVPKGPSLDPQQKRLAVAVEDHPLEYGGFEGVIPDDEYGGGTVMLWDRGHWTPEGDAEDGLKQGRLKFSLDGEKLRGRWMLVRMGPRPGEKGENWLLRKERDAHARDEGEYNILADKPKSVGTGRTMDQIAAARDRVWTSAGEASPSAPKGRADRAKQDPPPLPPPRPRPTARRKPTTDPVNAATIVGARKAPLPRKPVVALATLVDRPPAGEWLHEIKLDGYRILATLDGGRARLVSRNGKDWTARFRPLAEALAALPAQRAIVDGEVVVMLPTGVSSFQALQNVLKGDRGDVVYYLFDLLYLNGYDLRAAAIEDRKAALESLLAAARQPALRYCEHIADGGERFFAECCRMGLEGMIAKRAGSGYPVGRGGNWLKVKCLRRQEFVIGGFTPSTDKGRRFGALLVGYVDGGELRYAGRVGTGWTDRSMDELARRFSKLLATRSPFAAIPRGSLAKGTRWLRPELVAEVAFTEWTADGRLRHPSFQGLREDKRAEDVRMEKTRSVDRPKPTISPRRRTPPQKAESPAARGAVKRASPRKGAGRARAPALADPAAALASVRLTHPDRVLYVEQGISKVDLARYYATIAPWVLPHIAGRPLSLVRCPRGQGNYCFYQKHLEGALPDGLDAVDVPEEDKVGRYAAVKDVRGLVSLVQLGVLEIHPWGARSDNIERPDRLVFDLDPDPSVAWPRVVAAARRLREILDALGLTTFLKTTGGKGLHLVVPIARRYEWPKVKLFSRGVVDLLAADEPAGFTTNMSKAARKGRIYLDYLRNDRGSTAVAAYSTRSKPRATVSCPIAWEELDAIGGADVFHLGNVPERLASLARDPWAGMLELRQSLPPLST